MRLKIAHPILFTIFCSCIVACQVSSSSIPIIEQTTTATGKIVPSYFQNGDRIFFHLPTISGDTIKAYTDTGGGWTIIYPDKIDALKMDNKMILNIESNNYMLANQIFEDTRYHPALNSDQKAFSEAPLFQIPTKEFLNEIGGDHEGDAFFGQFFFIDKCWTFDYIHQKVTVQESCNLDVADPNTQNIGFKKDADGRIE